MSEIPCPKMDSFKQALREQCRRREEVTSRDHTVMELTYVSFDIARCHENIADHRYVCPICRNVRGGSERSISGLDTAIAS